MLARKALLIWVAFSAFSFAGGGALLLVCCGDIL
jgi:hypothetical protein